MTYQVSNILVHISERNTITPKIKARIIITTFNCDEDLFRCVESLNNQTNKSFDVVIVNNSQNPVTPPNAWKSYTWLSMIQSNENTGFAGGNNIGSKNTDAEWIISLNPDAWPERDWFSNLMKAAEDHSTYCMLSSTLMNANSPALLDGAGDCYSIFGIGWRGGQNKNVSSLPQLHREVLAPCGAAAAYRRIIFNENEGFDEDYFCYLEDLDIGIRLQLQGQKCLHVYDARVAHVGGGSTGVNSYFQLYHTHKNQIRLIIKTTPVALLVIQLPVYFLTQFYFLLRTFGTPHWIARVRGMRDGIKQSFDVFFSVRPQVQKQRKISLWQYCKLISWSCADLRNKSM